MLHERRAPNPPELRGLEEHVGPVGGTSPATAPRTVAKHEQVRFTLNLVSHLTAQAASLRHPFLGHHRRTLDTLHAVLRRPLLVLRQRVPDLVPGRLRANKNVALGFDSQLTIEVAGRNKHHAPLRFENRRYR